MSWHYAAKTPAKFQSDQIILNTNLMTTQDWFRSRNSTSFHWMSPNHSKNLCVRHNTLRFSPLWIMGWLGWDILTLILFSFFCEWISKSCAMSLWMNIMKSLQWSRNGCNSISNYQPHDCLLNRLFRRRSKKTSKLRVTGLCVGNSPGTVKSPHKWPAMRKMFPFDDVIMANTFYISSIQSCSCRINCRNLT